MIELTGFQKTAAGHVTVTVAGQKIQTLASYDDAKQAVVVLIPETSVCQEIRVWIDRTYLQEENPVAKTCFDFLNQAEISFELKDRIYRLIEKEKRIPVLIAELGTMGLETNLYGALLEMITAKVS